MSESPNDPNEPDDSVPPEETTYSETRRKFRKFLGSTPESDAFEDRVCNTPFRDKTIGELPVRTKGGIDVDYRYEKNFAEAIGVAMLLAAANIDVLELEPQEPPLPDFRAKLANGSTVQIEFARVVLPETAAQRGLIDQLNFAINKARRDDPAFQAFMMEKFLEVRIPATLQGKERREDIVNELLSFARKVEYPAKMKTDRFEDEFPALKALGAKWFVKGGAATAFSVAADAATFGLDDLTDRTIEMLKQKHTKKYGPNPWLFLYLGELHADPTYTMAALADCELDLGQFSCLVVGDGPHALYITRQRP